MEWDRVSLEEWQRYQPLSILQLDVADRAVLRVAGILMTTCVTTGESLTPDDKNNRDTRGEYRLDFIDRIFYICPILRIED